MKQDFVETLNNNLSQLSFVNIIGLYEASLGKDLSSFSKEEILIMLKDLATTKKIETINAYSSLIKNYKKWCMANDIDCKYGNITKSDYKDFDYKDYLILNDDMIDDLTIYNDLDGGDFISAGVIRIFWETQANVSLEDILNLNLSQINFESKILRFNDIDYIVSDWLINFLEEYVNLTKMVFKNKHGSYEILTAKDNLGVVFRKAKTRNFIVGCPITKESFRVLLVRFSDKYSEQNITWTDLLISMAIRDMYKNFKTPLEIVKDERYLNLCDNRCEATNTSKYGRLFNISKNLYQEDYIRYIEHFSNL